MKAAVFYAKHDLRVEEVPDIDPREDEVKIKVKFCGVCGTDMHIYNGDDGSAPIVPPLIPGHEFSGTVTTVGSKVKHIKPGDRVTADPNDMCGTCFFCRNGQANFCQNHIGIGTTAPGAFAEYICTREKQVYKFSDSVSFEEAALSEPLSCCLHGIDLCKITPGSTVLIIGGGSIGLLMVQLAKNAGAARIIVSEPVETKRKLALKFGADLAIDPLKTDLKNELERVCKNIETVIECVGNTHTIQQAIQCAGNGATIMMFGLTGPDEKFAIKPYDIFKRELHLTSSFINPYTMQRAITLIENKRIDVKNIITSIVPIDIITEVFTNVKYKNQGKILIKIS